MTDGPGPDPASRLRVGIVANELFSTHVGRMGGFGWAVQQVSRCFADEPALGVDVVLLMGEQIRADACRPELHGSPVLWRTGSLWSQARRVRSARIDLLLSIDYRPSYRLFFYLLPRVPILVWVRDPWDARDRNEAATLRIPGREAEEPQGLPPVDTRGLRQAALVSRLGRRPLLFATTARFLASKIPDAYDVTPGDVHLLPNIVERDAGRVEKARRPTVAFLARLDPVKRPWLFAALAARFPDVDFLFMGQSHFRGPGTWEPRELSPNVLLLGHLNQSDKQRALASAWLLVNTSIHEGLAVSFLEALASETPIVSCVDPEGVVSRFGIWVGSCPGTGMQALPRFEAAIRELLGDAARRARLGAEGRAWVGASHNRSRFLEAFFDLCALVGLGPRPRSGAVRQPVWR